MNYSQKSKEQLQQELQELQKEHGALKESFNKNILQNKESEEKLKKSEEKYRLLAESIKDVIWILDTETMNFTYVSPSVFNLRGYTPKEVMAHTADAALTPEGVEFVRNEIRKKVEDFISGKISPGDHFISEVQQPCKNGTLVWTEVITTYYKNPETGHIEVRGVTRDISKRKLSEEEYKKTAEKYQLLFENAVESIIVVQDNVLKLSNPMAEALLGYSSAILSSMPFINLIHQEDRETVLDRYTRRMKGEEVLGKYAFRILRIDNSIRWVEMNSIRIEWDGRPASLSFLTDITDRKQAEEEIRNKNEKLEKVNREKDKFFSIIAHDLRSPFNVFLGLTQVIAEDLHSMTLDEIQEIAVNLRDSASKLYRLLVNLLEWSQMQQGLIPFNPKTILLSSIVNESLTLKLQIAKAKNIKIINDITDNFKIVADSYMLQAVIRNLVSNAIKFTPREGEIRLSAKAISDDLIEISIEDSGIGMNQDIVESLFRIDVKAGRTGTEGEPSTGLGLLICKEFIEKHGGRIRVESEEGRGSKFYFSLHSPEE